MKISLPTLVGVVVVVLAWFVWSGHRDNAELRAQINQLQAEHIALQEQVALLQQELAEPESGSVAEVVEEANDSLKQGLRTMLEAAEQEFNKLQKTLDETLEEWEQVIPQDPQTDDEPVPDASTAEPTHHQT